MVGNVYFGEEAKEIGRVVSYLRGIFFLHIQGDCSLLCETLEGDLDRICIDYVEPLYCLLLFRDSRC